MTPPWHITRHEPSIIGVLIALVMLPVVVLAYAICRVGEWVEKPHRSA